MCRGGIGWQNGCRYLFVGTSPCCRCSYAAPTAAWGGHGGGVPAVRRRQGGESSHVPAPGGVSTVGGELGWAWRRCTSREAQAGSGTSHSPVPGGVPVVGGGLGRWDGHGRVQRAHGRGGVVKGRGGVAGRQGWCCWWAGVVLLRAGVVLWMGRGGVAGKQGWCCWRARVVLLRAGANGRERRGGGVAELERWRALALGSALQRMSSFGGGRAQDWCRRAQMLESVGAVPCSE